MPFRIVAAGGKKKKQTKNKKNHRRGVEIAAFIRADFIRPLRDHARASRATRGANQWSGALEICAPYGAISH
jgi:hypothetical protein